MNEIPLNFGEDKRLMGILTGEVMRRVYAEWCTPPHDVAWCSCCR